MYRVTKTYGHELGLSACFRQWRANSHCRFLHGYALSFRFVFESKELDIHNWVIDFGGFRDLKTWLTNTFDHKLIVAEDDPMIDELTGLGGLGLASPLVLPSVGCERFAEMACTVAQVIVNKLEGSRVRVVSVEVREHGANSAIYIPPVAEEWK